MRGRVHLVLSGLLAAVVAVEAAALAWYLAGLDRWVESEGRLGVADRAAMRSSDPYEDSNGPSVGVLDRGLVDSAPQWLDVGAALTVAEVLARFVVPPLALAVLISRPSLRVLGAVVLAVLPVAAGWVVGVAGPIAVVLLLGRGRPRRVLPGIIAAAVLVEGFALAVFASWVQGYLGRRGSLWTSNLYDGPGWGIFSLVALIGVPILALVLGVVTLVRRPFEVAPLGVVAAGLLATGLFVLAIGPAWTVAAAGWALASIAAFALACARRVEPVPVPVES